MRATEILREYHHDPIPEEKKQQAEALGFDTSKIWFHGSRKTFDKFRNGRKDRGVNELGVGVYLTGHWSTAIAFGNVIYDCYIKKGPIYDFNERPSDELVEAMFKAYHELGGPNPRWQEYENFKYDVQINYRKYVSASVVKHLGYIGGVDKYSQITDQIVIFDPKNVFVGVANPAGEWGDRR